LRIRQIPAVSEGELLELALRQDGTNPGVTKTKLRKAVALLLRERAKGLGRLAS
jgi:hypothetical protein